MSNFVEQLRLPGVIAPGVRNEDRNDGGDRRIVRRRRDIGEQGNALLKTLVYFYNRRDDYND